MSITSSDLFSHGMPIYFIRVLVYQGISITLSVLFSQSMSNYFINQGMSILSLRCVF